MKKILFYFLLVSVFTTVKSQNIDTICTKSVVYLKVDSVQSESIRKIENKFNSFYARNRQSQTFYVIGLGLFGVAILTTGMVDQKFTNLTYGIGALSCATGLYLNIDSFNYFNPRRKNKKSTYFINYLAVDPKYNKK